MKHTFILRLAITAALAWAPHLNAATKPNIILVLTDDQGYGDLACHGHPFIKTPNIDKLYSQSARFTDYHVSPTCAPTRAGLMSGLDPFRVGVTHTILERERMALNVKTVADVLKTAGYSTGIFGKWHLGDDDAYQPEKRGFDEVFIHGAGGIGQRYAGTQGAVPGTSYYGPIIKHNGTFVKTEGYCTDVFFQQSLGWIKQCKENQQPFFAYIATNAPHSPYIVDDAYSKPYVDKIKLKGKGKKGPSGVSKFLGMCTNIDDNMGVLMEKLDQWKLADNTILIYMTDNGSSNGSAVFNAGMKGKKGSVNQGGARVPFLLRWPGVAKPASDIPQLTRHFDVLPTLAEVAGAELPKGYKLAGRSLMPLLKKEKASWPDRHLFINYARWDKGVDPADAKYKRFAVRNTRWRLVENKFLYDIQQDPGEKNNLIEKHPEVAKDMMKAFEIWWTSMRPYMINEDATLDTGKPFIEAFEKQKAEKGIPKWEKPQL